MRGKYADLLADHRRILREAFARWNGHEVDTQGDSFFVAFSRASDAVSCAVAGQRALSAVDWPDNVAVKVRMGIHTGEPLVAGVAGLDYVGLAVHQAARIAGVGHGGQILVSATTRDVVADALPSDIGLSDLGAYRLKDLRNDVRLYQVRADGLAAEFVPLATAVADEPPPSPGEAPYRGLEAFGERDAPMFFGRTDVVDQLTEQVRESRFVALIGASGSGKSSILRAGLIPQLRAAGMASRVLLFTPTAHPIEELAGVLEPVAPASRLAALADELRADPRVLALAIRSGRAGSSPREAVIVAVDQLEEVFTLCRSEDDRRLFLTALEHACGLDEGPADQPADVDRARVIVTLRADFYAHLAPYPELRSAAAGSQLYVGAMSPEELRMAIEEPARIGGWQFTPGLVDLLLRDVGDEPGALPLLSHALLETWHRRRGTAMTLHSYSESGGVKSAIARTADRVYDGELSDPERRIAHDIFVRLTELGEGAQDTRRRASLRELVPADEPRAAQTRTVIKALADARLVTVSEDSVEVAHEALIREWPTLREWLRSDRDGLRIHRRLTEASTEWEVAGRDNSLLFRGARLAQTREATAYKGELSPLEQQFLDASVALEESEAQQREEARQRELASAQALTAAERRRAEESARAARGLRRRAIFITVALALVAVLAGVAFVLARQSDSNAALADQRALEASANAALAQRAAQEAQDNQAAAEVQARQSRAQRLGADAGQILLTGREPELAAQLALIGLHTGYTAEGDGALQRASRQQSGLAFRHDGQVDGVALSPDGRTVYSASDGQIHIWDVGTGQPLGKLPIPPTDDPEPYWQVKLSNDGSILFASNYWGPAALYRIDPTKPAAAQQLAADCPDVNSPALRAMSGNGQVLAVYDDVAVRFVRLPDCQPMGVSITAASLNDPALSDDGSMLVASVADTSEMLVWDVTTGKTISEFPRLGGFWHPDFSADGSRVAVGMFDGTAYLFDTLGGERLTTFGGHLDSVSRAVVAPDGDVLTSSVDGTARLWDASTGDELRRIEQRQWVTQSVMSPDGRWVYTASDDGTVRQWAAGGEGFDFEAGENGVSGLSFSPDGTLVASAAPGSIRIFDRGLGQVTLDVPMEDARLAVFSPTQDTILAVSGLDSYLLDLATGGQTRIFSSVDSEGSAVAGSFSADGSRMLVTAPGTSDEVFLVDTATGDQRQIFQVSTAALSPDGTRVVGWFAGRYSVYDAATGDVLMTVSLPDRDTRPVDLVFTPDGSRFVSGDHDNVVRVRDAESGAVELEMAGHGSLIRQVRVSADGRYALTAGYDGGARYWDLQTGKQIRYFPGHEGRAVTSIAISPDGRAVALGSSDGVAIIAPTSLDELSAKVCSQIERQLSDVDRIAFSLTSDDQPCP